jgi:hypothetical protein
MLADAHMLASPQGDARPTAHQARLQSPQNFKEQMMPRQSSIAVSPALQPLFGSHTSRATLLTILGTAGAGAAAAWITTPAAPLPRAAVSLLAADLAGGIVANASPGTNRWYRAQPAWISYAFLVAHAEQPWLAARLLAPHDRRWWPRLWLWALLSGAIVLALRGSARQRSVALVLTACGLLTTRRAPHPTLRWLGALYLIKLVLCFAVAHHERHES